MRYSDIVEVLLERAARRDLDWDRDAAEFAVRFTALMLDVALADHVMRDSERSAMADALDTWTGLPGEAIELVIDTVAERLEDPSPEHSASAAAEFARRYDLGSALLVLDCLFSVATAEGSISDEELEHLEGVAAALQVDPALFARFRSRWVPDRVHGDLILPLEGDVMRIGRAASCEVQLDDPEIAAHHATLRREGGEWTIEAATADTVTLVENRRIERERLGAGDRVRVGRHTLRLVTDLDQLHVFAATTASALTVRDLRVSVPSPGGPRTILQGVSFTVFAGELVGLIGPSGSGKTTLLTAISGVRQPEGEVLLDGEPFHPLLAASRNLVGEVPQEDIVHPSLTVRESLWYSARLRLAQDLRDDEIAAQVDRVLDELDIRAIRDSRIGDATRRGISGGQRKRVNLGQELLSQSTHILFLDEPTSGLDPHGSREIVRLTRRLADDGRIVFLVTHDLSPQVVEMLDQVIVLTEGGRLAFYGPPAEACRHFGVRRLDEVITALRGQDVAKVAARFRDSDAFRRYVTTRERVLGIGPVRPSPRSGAWRPGSRSSRLRQLSFMVRRYGTVKLRDRGGLAILLLQAPILAVIMAVVFPVVDPSALFIVALATLWFGCSSAVREVIAELPILRRERRAGLRLVPYLGSKFLVLLVICALQCLLLVGLLVPLMDMGDYGFSLPALYLVTLLTGMAGIAMGLLVSCAFTSSEAAVGTLPLILIPQIVFGGLIVYVKDMGLAARVASHLTVVRWSFNALLRTGEELVKPGGAAFERVRIPMSGILYLLGFRTSTDVTEMGPGLGTLCGVLAGIAVGLLAASYATLRTRERRRGL